MENRICLAALVLTQTALASELPRVNFELVDATALSPNAVAIDISVQLGAGDAWQGGGITADTSPGATFAYSDNDAETLFTDPDYDNSGSINHLLATFVSLPRPQNSLDRFRMDGAALLGGGLTAPFPTADSMGFDVAFLRDPNSRAEFDGYVTRLVIEGVSPSGLYLTTTYPGFRPYCGIRFVCATSQFAGYQPPRVYLVPEPAPWMAFSIAVLFLGRRQTRI